MGTMWKNGLYFFLVIMAASCNNQQRNSSSVNNVDSESMQHIQDSLDLITKSKELYDKEGDRIFGDFKFGMSMEDYSALVNKIRKETGGVIRIGEVDMRFYNYSYCYTDWREYVDLAEFAPKNLGGGLYSLTVLSKKDWDETSRQYNRPSLVSNGYVDDWDTEQYKNSIDLTISSLVDQLQKTYGEPQENNKYTDHFLDAKRTKIVWHFLHKDIVIHDDLFTDYEEKRVNMTVRDRDMTVTLKSEIKKKNVIALTFVSNTIKAKIDSVRQVESIKQKEIERRKNDSINAIKSSFTEGL